MPELPADWLDHADEPDNDDPRTWTPPQVLGLAMRYAYGVEALRHEGGPGNGWDEAADAAEDVLFVRDRLAAWLEVAGEEGFEELVDEAGIEVPEPFETDDRLSELYRDDKRVRAFIDDEYRRFRDEIAPARADRWWWLDAELYGHGIH